MARFPAAAPTACTDERRRDPFRVHVHHHQVHPGRHAQGRRRRWRRPAHRPARLAAVPEDLGRSRAGAGASGRRLRVAARQRLLGRERREAERRRPALERLGRRPRRRHRRQAARLRRPHPVPRAQGHGGRPPAGRKEPEGESRAGPPSPPPAREGRLRGRLPVHEVGHPAAAGRQQDPDRRRLQRRHRPAPVRRHLRTDPQRPPGGRKRRGVLHAPGGHAVRGGHDRPPPRGVHPRPGLRHGRLPRLRHRARPPAGREDPPGRRRSFRPASGGWRRSPCRTCSAPPT